jgi:phosphatidylinositol 3-kinase
VRSCAGYCVATYVLGVGDRHLDNLMLTADGRLFHIDFGYILGNDPKPFPPPMKICKEMVEAMGGQGSEYYVQFRMYCCEAYNILRKSADLILSLFHLMAGASIETIRADPEKAILKLQVSCGSSYRIIENCFTARLWGLTIQLGARVGRRRAVL